MWKQVLQPGTWAKQTKWRWSQKPLVWEGWTSFIIHRCTNSSFLIAGVLCPHFPQHLIHRVSAKYQFNVLHDLCWDYIFSLPCFPRLQLCFFCHPEGQLFLFYCIFCRDRFWFIWQSKYKSDQWSVLTSSVCPSVGSARSANSFRFLYQGNSTWSWTADEYIIQSEVVTTYRIASHSAEDT